MGYSSSPLEISLDQTVSLELYGEEDGGGVCGVGHLIVTQYRQALLQTALRELEAFRTGET